MPEETQAPADEQVQDTPEAPEEGGPEQGIPADKPESVDWEKRYNDLRPEFDRQNQRVSQLEEFYGQLADPETQADALRALGLELDAEEEEEYQDPEEVLAKRLEGVESYLTQQQEQAQEAELLELENQFVEMSISEIEKEHGSLSDQEKELLEGLADIYRDDDGLPDMAAAYERFVSATKAAQDRYLASKKADKPDLGITGTEKVNLNDPNARAKHAANIIEAINQAEEG